MTRLLTIDGITINSEKQLLALDRVECEDSLMAFVHKMWPIIEPATPLVHGWAMDAICEHLEAVTYGDITRLLINVPPGSSKSLLCNVFWPAWEWSMFPHLRYLSFSYAAHLTERDNRRFRDILVSRTYRDMFGDRFTLIKKGEEYVNNNATGFKVATSVGGVGTGERADRVILDDPHNVKEAESDTIRESTVEWFASAMSNRLNDMEKSAIVVIMQRVHAEDVSGFILDKNINYEHLCIPAEYEEERHCKTSIGWEDPRSVINESFWPDRFSKRVLDEQKRLMGPYGFAGQYQQLPAPKDGGIIKTDWWQLWEDQPCNICPNGREGPACRDCTDKKSEFPAMDYILASLDTAYTDKTENDYSALTVWGVFTHDPSSKMTRFLDIDNKPIFMRTSMDQAAPKLMMMYAWQDKLQFHDLVERVAKICRKVKVDCLMIENKAAGHSVAQEIKRLYGYENWSVILNDPKSQDKVSRLYSVQHVWAEKMIYTPDRSWADMVIRQMEQFPKGKHDDLVDTCSQAVRKLRDMGLLIRAEEHRAELEDAKQHRGAPPGPLYPV